MQDIDKKTLLYQIARSERSKMRALGSIRMRIEVAQWFNDSEEPSESDEEVLDDYIEDFMRWEEDKSIEELQEFIKNNKQN